MTPNVTTQRSELEEDYLALTAGVGLLDLSVAGKLEISGENAAQFLNGLVSNEVKSLSPGQGTLAAFLTVQGKVLAIARIYRKEASFLLEIEESNREKLFRNLSRFVPAGGFNVEDQTSRLGLISIQGPRAEDLLASVIPTAPGIEPFSHIACELASTDVLLSRNARVGTVGFDLYLPTEAYDEVMAVLLRAGELLGVLGVRLVGSEAFEAARIDAGIPREPDEVNENRILLEAGFDEAVSYAKGCYLGQEIIARIHWRGQPARQLRRLAIAGSQPPPIGTELYSKDEKKVGEITSVAVLPQSGTGETRIVALGYVHRHYLDEGTQFSLRREGVTIGEAKVRAR
ncbi:MAG: hypothetical protein ABI882_05150 [Acidobacteriota bacterium]